MFRVPRHFPIFVLLLSLVFVVGSGCNNGNSAASFGWQPMYGDFAKDPSPVLAQVGEISITEADVEIFISQQPERTKADYVGPEGERFALNRMVEQALMVMGAVDRKLYNDAEVARALVAQRRITLDRAMRTVGLLKDLKPTEEQLKEYYEKNKANYIQVGLVRARHIECLTKEDAGRAFRRLQSKDPKDAWIYVCEDMTQNKETKKLSGDAGWMSRGGVVPLIEGGSEFSAMVFDFPMGVSPPIEVAGRWHVVEISHRGKERVSRFEEARDRVMTEMMPGFQAAIINDYLKGAREKYGVKLMGRFTPGQGMTPKQLLDRAMLNEDLVRRIELLVMLHDDFPESDLADDALFMAGNTAIESNADLSEAEGYFTQLIEEYPASELVGDTRIIMENLYNPNFRNPTSIEDLQK